MVTEYILSIYFKLCKITAKNSAHKYGSGAFSFLFYCDPVGNLRFFRKEGNFTKEKKSVTCS